MNMIKLSFLKNRLSGILPVGHPSFSVVSGILSVVGIPPIPIPIPEEIQLLMYVHKSTVKRAPSKHSKDCQPRSRSAIHYALI